MTVDVLSAIVRALSFIALFQAVGVAIANALFQKHWGSSGSLIRQIGSWSAIAALVLTTLQYVLEAGRLSGAFAGIFHSELQQLVLHSTLSIAALLKIISLLLVASCLRHASHLAKWIGFSAALAGLFAFSLTGHVDSSSNPTGRWLLCAHLVIAAFWFGGLVPLLVTVRKETADIAARVVAAFTRIATYLVPALFLFGLLLTIILIDDLSVFKQDYGRLLLAKIALFALLMIPAALNKWKYGPRLAAPTARAALQRAIVIEYLLICAVLSVTAVMTLFFAPAD